MKTKLPYFGFISGISSSVGYLPHLLFLFFIMITQSEHTTSIVLIFTLGARILGDWLFWTQLFPSRIDLGSNNANWRLSIKDILTSKPTSINDLFDMFMDICADGLLLYIAVKISTFSLLPLLVFSSCQAIGSPLQGIILYVFNRKNFRRFSMIITALVIFTALEIGGIFSNSFYTNMFGLANVDRLLAICLLIGTKCLLAGTTVIAKTNIAETIQTETSSICNTNISKK